MKSFKSSVIFALAALALNALGQQSRITKTIDSRQRITLAGHIHPKARPENDQGRVSPSLKLTYVTLTLTPSETQQADLDKLLGEQQTPGSPNYHRWLTPEEFAQRFGVSEEDLNKLSAWLEGQGFSIAAVARGRNWIAVNGSAAQVEAAFQTEIHHYAVDGETHFANATEPSVPEAFAGVVRSVRGLNDFRLKSAKHLRRSQLAPEYTSSRGEHYLAPADLATIYNMTPLYNAGINGSGQTIAIAGQTRINLSDIEKFRSTYGLPANDPQVLLIPNSQDPGLSTDDLPEADLDLEWSGAVASSASIIYVYAYDVMQAAQYAIDQNLAQVVSTSYGSCELETSRSDVSAFRSWAQQGNAQGITWFSASGDNGGADCADQQNPGLAVDLPGSIPEVTSVGGTEFQEGSGAYWNAMSNTNGASVLSYIPETSWNDSAADGSPSASGGGASVLFSKPSWQTGTGVPSDNARHVPDVSLTASADHDGYLVYTGGSVQVYGGTSVPTPAFAGIAALLNQYLASGGSGNINPKLYALAQSAPDVFHDITTGNNFVTINCPPRSRNCSSSAVGYSAGVGYDQVTGLGSVDVNKLVTKWSSATAGPPPPSASLALLSNLTTVANTNVVFLIATATGTNGVTPTGLVMFSAGGSSLGSAALVGSAGTGTATLAVNGAQLPEGSATITAQYTDSNADNLTASVNLTVTTGSGSAGTPSISSIANGASFKNVYAPGMILSIFGSQLAPSTVTASSVPLPNSAAGVAVTVNGVVAPLYYVSPGQLNVQIPYETTPNAAVTLSVNNNGNVASQSFNVAAAAPGIFTNQSGTLVPNGTASRGQIVTLYITGTGTVSPAISTGAAPGSATPVNELPAPVQPTTVKVGGVQATVEFIGIPPGLVGVTQINYQVPSSIAPGTQPVVVSVGGILSASANLVVTN